MTPKNLAHILAELSLTALSIASVVSLERLFADMSFVGRVVILILGSHLIAAASRRFGLGSTTAALVSGLAFVVVFTAVLYPETSHLFIPTGRTLESLGTDLSDAWAIYTDQSAPVATASGFVAVLGIAGWWLAQLADWAAFRLKSPVESLIPATSVFVFGALMGVNRHEMIHGAIFAGAVAAVLLSLRAERQTREESWASGGSGRGISTTLRVGGTTAVIAVLAGVVIGPLVPGAKDTAIVDFREITGGSQTRTVISPLVEISTSLVEQSNFEIFSVAVDKSDRDYWRLMALNSFDGNIWRRSSKFDDVHGPVGSDIDSSVHRNTITQTITTRRLGNIYLPAAYEVSQVADSAGIRLEYEAATGALVVKEQDQRKAEAGFTYTIESAVPDFDPADLPADATAGLDPSFVAENTALPPACGENESSATDHCWPTSVSDLARQITDGASTDHQRALLLQNYFLDPSRFTYDLDVALHENVADIEDFLFQVQRGYCEQFSSTFAAMARSLGIPARVAVGFTWGDWDEARGEYVVSGRHAHAWPEVYFAGAGWVAFDPTPGRARPTDSDITGLQAAQFGVNDGTNRQLSSTTDPTPTTTRAPAAGNGDGATDGSGLSALKDPTQQDTATGTASGSDDNGSGTRTPVMILAFIVAALFAVPVERSIRHRFAARRAADDSSARGEWAFDQAIASLTLLNVEYRFQETPYEFESRIAREWPQQIPGVHELMRAVTVLRYGQPVDAVLVADDAAAASEKVIRYCRSTIGRQKLALHFLDPRRVGPMS